MDRPVATIRRKPLMAIPPCIGQFRGVPPSARLETSDVEWGPLRILRHPVRQFIPPASQQRLDSAWTGYDAVKTYQAPAD